MSEQVTAINKQSVLGFRQKFFKWIFFEAVKEKTADTILGLLNTDVKESIY